MRNCDCLLLILTDGSRPTPYRFRGLPMSDVIISWVTLLGVALAVNAPYLFG